MASIKKRDNGKWRARYRDDAGREHARHFARKVDAQRWLDEVTTSVVTGQYVDPRAGKVTVREYAEQWRKAQVWRDKTERRVESALRLHVLPVLGDRAVSSVRPTDVQGLVKRWSEDDLSPSTVRTVYAVLRGMFKAAVQDRIIPASPCVGARLPKVPGGKTLTIPDVSTVHGIADALPARWSAVAYVAAGLGLRPGEVFGLRVEDVDFLRRSVTVQQQLDDRGQIGPLKTDASYRTVPLPDVVARVLSRHLEQHRGGLVFTGPDGQPVKRNTFENVWRRSATAAGAHGLRLHDLRHVYASALIHAGESVKTVQKRLGHSSAAMTLDVYSHLWPDSDERSRAAVDSYLAPVADSVRTQGA